MQGGVFMSLFVSTCDVPIAIETVDHRDRKTAEKILAIQRAAYAQEAALLQVSVFPPLEREVEDIEHSADHFIGARIGSELAGLMSIERRAESLTLWISSLTVSPAFQRRGVASALLNDLMESGKCDDVMVSTDIRNKPALALYIRFGFVPVGRRVIDDGAFELIDLRRIFRLA
jgi:ribosomal protein S18 acetylase RimI-like enzyme